MVGDFFLTNWLMEGMRWLSENVMGGSIILTIVVATLLIKAITLIGDVKSRQSSLKMQSIQPELDRLQKKYEHDPQKFQQARKKLMNQEGVSMFGGCLPLLFMLPLFICFIAAFRFWGYEQMVKMLLQLNENGSTQLFDSFQFAWVRNIWQPDNATVPVLMSAENFFNIANLNKLLYFEHFPQAKEVFFTIFPMGTDGKFTAEAIAKYNELVAPIANQYAGQANGWFILPVLAAGTNFLSMWVSQKRMKSRQLPQGEAAGTANAATNKTMTFLMPVVSFIACLSANAAFAIYWVISSIVAIVTNLVINRVMDNKKAKGPSTVEVKKT